LVVYELAPIGGLEEIVVNLALTLKEKGVKVSVVSMSHAVDDNRYRLRLKHNQIPLWQPPQWFISVFRDWSAKDKLLATLLRWLRPLVYILALGVLLLRGDSWPRAIASSKGWVGGQLMARLIAPDHSYWFLRYWITGWRLLWRPDVYHVHGYTKILVRLGDWLFNGNIPVVYQEHSTPALWSNQWEGYEPVNKSAAVLAVSEACAEGLREICRVSLPVQLVPGIVHDPGKDFLDGISQDENQRRIKVTTFANLYPVKGLEYLLLAIAQVKRQRPDVDFRIFGDGPQRDELTKKADELGLAGDRIFCGSFGREEMPSILAETDIFVMSSLSEAMPVSLIEAKAYGRCIVATAVGGIPELIIDNHSGLLCAPRDPDALSRQLLRVINDPAIRAKFGQQARREYEASLFSPDRSVAVYMEIYRKVVLLSSSTRENQLLPSNEATAGSSQV
jgi:glycosyltransferase involved in cell wall biosynthesis